jgi:hypothetical protein
MSGLQKISDKLRSTFFNLCATISSVLQFDQLIWEFGDEDNPDWVHVSYVYDGVNRGRCLKALRDDKGKVYYEVIFGKGL